MYDICFDTPKRAYTMHIPLFTSSLTRVSNHISFEINNFCCNIKSVTEVTTPLLSCGLSGSLAHLTAHKYY